MGSRGRYETQRPEIVGLFPECPGTSLVGPENPDESPWPHFGIWEPFSCSPLTYRDPQGSALVTGLRDHLKAGDLHLKAPWLLRVI